MQGPKKSMRWTRMKGIQTPLSCSFTCPATCIYYPCTAPSKEMNWFRDTTSRAQMHVCACRCNLHSLGGGPSHSFLDISQPFRRPSNQSPIADRKERSDETWPSVVHAVATPGYMYVTRPFLWCLSGDWLQGRHDRRSVALRSRDVWDQRRLK
ncbi:hypothetical protein M011DRAFT_219099 [Sporormia fimetaria CBS 119925]|uniref:Uncharacterized protein n=1 Tax=Sporormia fimetaria CBS 119925 TaxID=1340428 RepID=A0A6A6UZ64_9PLEO|nr:hypothetical protein M011DRAFT_219099 [Sporormia fimetaria CBS 119925]